MSKMYAFASLRGDDFVISGDDPEEAWFNLCEREKNNGSLWKTSCEHRNAAAVDQEGFSYLFLNKSSSAVAYKQLTCKDSQL